MENGVREGEGAALMPSQSVCSEMVSQAPVTPFAPAAVPPRLLFFLLVTRALAPLCSLARSSGESANEAANEITSDS